jgi:hypothetical protein
MLEVGAVVLVSPQQGAHSLERRRIARAAAHEILVPVRGRQPERVRENLLLFRRWRQSVHGSEVD